MKLAISEDNTKIHWSLFLLVLFALGLYLRWPVPAPEWQHVDERAFILHPLGFWSGDLNPHFFNYPTLHFYLASALYYVYYFVGDFASLSSFVAYRYFVDGGDLVDLTRGFNSVLSSLTGVVCALIGRRLYGLWGGMAAGGLFSVLPLSVRFAHLAIVDVPLALWSLAALYFAVRVVQDGRLRDVLWGGIFAGLETGARFYFLHSYYFGSAEEDGVLADTDYNGVFASSVHSGNVYGVQFHPEKSHHWGVRLLENFARL